MRVLYIFMLTRSDESLGEPDRLLLVAVVFMVLVNGMRVDSHIADGLAPRRLSSALVNTIFVLAKLPVLEIVEVRFRRWAHVVD